MFIGIFLSHTFGTTCVTKPTQDSSGMTLVMLAAAGGQDDLLRLLLRKGAKVNGRQKNGTTALIHAAEKVGHLACCASTALGLRQNLCLPGSVPVTQSHNLVQFIYDLS